MEERKNMNIEMENTKESHEDIDMITMFDDCESGFLAKNEKLLQWILS